MSHQIPAVPPPTGPAHFLIQTNNGSVSVSGAFSLLGVSPINTFVSGSATIYISGTGGSSSALIFQADSGTASASGGILNVTTGPGYIQTTGTGNTLSIQSNTVTVPFGGTGVIDFSPSNGVLYGKGVAPIGFTSPGVNGQVLLSALGNPPKFSFITSSAQTLTFSYGPNALNIEVINGGGLTIQGNLGTATPAGNILSIIGTNLITTVGAGSTLSISLNTTNSFFNPLQVGYGGTGQSILTTYGVLIGEGSLGVDVTDPGTDGQVLLAASGADPAFGTITSSGGTLAFTPGPNSLNIDVAISGFTIPNPLPVTMGGTGLTLLTTYGVLIGEGSNNLDVTAPGTDGQVLLAASGNDPAFGTITSSGGTLTFTFGPNSLNIDVAIAGFSVTIPIPLPVTMGGTGLTLLTAYGVLIGEGSNNLDVTAPGTDGQVLLAASGADPAFGTITSSGGTLTFTFGPNSLNIDVAISGFTLPNPLPVTMGGTGLTLLTAYGVLIGEGSNNLDVTAPGTDGQVLLAASGADPAFGTITSSGGTLTFTFGPNSLNIDVAISGFTLPNPLPVTMGGTGLTLLTAYGVLIGEGSNNLDVTAPGTDGQVLLAASGADPAFGTITSSGGTLTFTFGPNSLNIDVAIAGFSVTIPIPLPVTMGGTGLTLLTAYGVLIGEGSNNLDVTAPGTDGQVLLAASGADPAFGTITSSGGTLTFTFGPNSLNIEATTSPSFTFANPLPVANGGTGRTLLTTYGVLLGEGSNNVNVTAAGTNGQVLLAASGADPAFGTITSSGGTLTFTFGPHSLNIEVTTSPSFTFATPFPVVIGGTGRTLLTTYGVLLGEGSNNVNVTAAGTNGQILVASTTGDPKFSTITSSGHTLSFTFGPNSLNIDVNIVVFTFPNPWPVSNGGTGRTLLTSYGVLLGEGSNSINVTAAGTNGQVLIASTTGDPAFGTITSSGGTLTFTFGPNALNIDVPVLVGFTFAIPMPVGFGGTGQTLLTAFGVLIGEGSNNVNVTAAGTDGQLLIASTTGDPAFGTITSSGGTLTFTFGPNSLNIDVPVLVGFTFAIPMPVGFGGTGQTLLTTFGVLIGEGSNNVNVTAAGTDGQLLIASSAGDPAFGTITSSGGTLTFTFGPNSLNIDVSVLVGFTFAIPMPVGFGGTGQTLLTAFGVLIGEGSNNVNVTAAGTDGQLLIASSAGDPAFGTITSSGGTLTFTFGPNALNIDVPVLVGFTFAIPMPVGFGGTGQTLLTAFGVLIGEGSNNVNVTAAGTDGQVLIASSAGDPVFGTITSTGGTLSFTFGPNALNIDVANTGGIVWSTISTSATLQAGNGYLCIGSSPLTFALPPTPVVGTEVALALSGAPSWEIDLSGSEEIRFGYLTTSIGPGGGLQSSSQGDVVFLVCFDAGAPQWLVVDSIGNIQIF